MPVQLRLRLRHGAWRRRISPGDEEKAHALRRIMLHQTGRDADFTPGMVRSVCVLRLKVEAISAKLHACPEPPPSR
ncbi:hypothetical protein [Akkermansia muciniphila]|uniref:hypothetical protein n=1 Tax=Akkermansia muciniphila TaxID=239935 RepID=UPI0021C8D92A|nr:hypothetical protein [Akkermansia muciniphila]